VKETSCLLAVNVASVGKQNIAVLIGGVWVLSEQVAEACVYWCLWRLSSH
jgi:hypothetical protein